jgi:hypothetical protein
MKVIPHAMVREQAAAEPEPGKNEVDEKRRGKLALAEITVSGGADPQVIETAVRGRAVDFERCANEVYGAAGIPAGGLEIRIVFNADGTLKEIKAKAAPLRKAFNDCLQKRLQEWTIPAAATGGKRVEVTFKLKP